MGAEPISIDNEIIRRIVRAEQRRILWGRIGYTPHAHQAQVHAAIDRGAKRLATVAGRRGGKSELWASEALTEMAFGPEGHLPKRLVLIAGPESDTTDHIFRLLWKWIVTERALEAAPVRKSERERYIEMPWGARVEGKTTKDPTSLRGPGLVLTIADEYAFGDDCLSEHLEAPLLDCNGILGLPTTPNGRNHYYATYLDWQAQQAAGDGYYYAGTWTSYDNPFLPAGAVARIEAQYKRTGNYDIFRQEYLAEFNALQGAVYPAWDETLHVAEFEPLPEVPLVLGFDWGFQNPFSVSIAQVWNGDQVRIFDEIYESGLTDEQKASAIMAKVEAYGLPVSMGYADPSSPQAIKTFREHNIPMFDPADNPHKININSVTDGLAVVRGLLGREPEPGLIVHPRCANHRREFPQYKFSEKTSVNEKPVKSDDHAMDSTRYLCMGAVGPFRAQLPWGFAA